MQQATIKVQYINPPKGRGPASIKDSMGVYWKVWTTGKTPIPLESFREGGTYTVGFKTEQYEGKDQHTILSVQSDNNPAPPPSEFTPHPPRAITPPNGKYAPTDNGTAERIFVCGGINHAIAAGKVDVYSQDELVSAIESLRSAYQATLGRAT